MACLTSAEAAVTLTLPHNGEVLVKALVWVGVPTERYRETARFFQTVMGLRVEFDEQTTMELSTVNGDRVHSRSGAAQPPTMTSGRSTPPRRPEPARCERVDRIACRIAPWRGAASQETAKAPAATRLIIPPAATS
jgi:hypothetical protein